MHILVDLYRHLKFLIPAAHHALRRHRWFLVLPLLLVVVGITAREARWAGAAVESETFHIGPKTTPATVHLPGGITGVLAPGGVIDAKTGDVQLRAGSVLVSSQGMIEIQAGQLRASGWNGGFSVSVDRTTVTVAAITTPVLVEGDHGKVLVPVRSQWRGFALPSLHRSLRSWMAARTLRPLPPDYVQERVSVLQALPVSQILPTFPATGGVTADLLSFLRLPAARERADHARTDDGLARLSSLLSSGQRDGILALIAEGKLPQILAVPGAQHLVPRMLAQATDQQLSEWFLPAFLVNDDRWLIGSVHPLLQTGTWTSDAPLSQTEETMMLRILSLPLADQLPDASNDLTIERWGDALAAFLRSAKDPAQMASALLPSLTTSIDHSDRKGYPLRTERYAAALLAAVSPWRALLGDAANKPLLHRLQELSQHSVSPTALNASIIATESAPAPRSPAQRGVVGSQSSQSSSSLELLPSDELQARAMAALREANALFTIHASLEPLKGRNAIHVTGIAFSTSAGDVPAEFSYDVDSGMVFDVTRDGQPMPYAVSLQSYIEWLGKGRE